jgi:asparagine synthase (glutamine-hydrolysing)
VVEYVQRLAPAFKVRTGSRKWLHRQVCKEFLPGDIYRRPKRGFAVNVVDDWFRHAGDSSMNDMLKDPSSKIYDYLNPSSVDRLVSEHQTGQENHYKLLFSLLVCETLMRQSGAETALSVRQQ